MSEQNLSAIEQLLVKEACRELVLRIAAHADQGEFEAMTALFSQDAVLQRPGGDPLQGRDAILASYRARPADRISQHLVLGTLFSTVAADTARAVTQVQVWNALATDEAGPFGRPARTRELVGRFDDEFRLEDGQWRIVKRQARFDLFIALD